MKINTFFNRWLFCCFLFIAAIIAARIKYTGHSHFIFLIWNLFLAYIPYILSEFFKTIYYKAKWKQVALFVSWLLFFPNALYIVTDIIHLEEIPGVPLWFDAVLLFTSSFAGLALAFASLANVEIFMSRYFSRKTMPALIMLLLFAGSFGVYLGRFQRWNSWNVKNNPLALAADITGRFINPAAHFRSWVIVFFLTILYSVCWYFLKAFPKTNKMEIYVG